jgi:hypothetical protein
VRLSPLGTSATVGLLYQPRMIDDDYGAVGGIRIGRWNRSTRRKPAPVPLCRPQIPHDLTWDRTRAAATVGSQRLTAWAMARPSFISNLHEFAPCILTRIWLYNIKPNKWECFEDVPEISLSHIFSHREASYIYSKILLYPILLQKYFSQSSCTRSLRLVGSVLIYVRKASVSGALYTKLTLTFNGLISYLLRILLRSSAYLTHLSVFGRWWYFCRIIYPVVSQTEALH